MNEAELRAKYPRASESFIKLNADQVSTHSAIGATGPRPHLTPRPEVATAAVNIPTPPPKRSGKASVANFAKPLIEPAREIHVQPTTFQAFVPVPILSEANSRKHWRAKLLHVKKQREQIGLFLYTLKDLRPLGLPTTIAFERVAANELDRDNLVAAFKAAQDTIAEMLGFDDRNKAVTWTHTQTPDRKATKGFYVRVTWGGAAVCPFCLQSIPEALNRGGGRSLGPDEAPGLSDKE